ncbi:MBL fold metallo-hydrolase [Aestuariivirga sp.]|uniref:MBL fold metallo-hydrolase n=1 Tax=Aestuariivirga sp. TaxID=2650926 RepID=UPI0025BD3E60|nr:MBL fold metallo-hydrolase [Aestuariivirga sp.]MCA3556465.1 MBL fold metallo-hydrolase [Aestuariivirga sp.]
MTDLIFDRNFDGTPGRAQRLSPLVRRVLANNPGPYTFKGTNSFIVGNGQVAVIDPGPDDDTHLAALIEAVRGETVTHILVTHSHADHSPLATRLKQATGAVTLAHGAVAAPASPGLRLDASIDHGFVPDKRLAEGDTVTGPGWTLEALFTPGHMSNHMCFALNEEQALFAGDHVMAWATSVIAPPDGDMGQYFASLRKLLDRDDHIHHPGHGPSRRDPLPLVRGYLAHRRMREEAIRARVEQGARSVSEIVASIYADVDPKLHGAAALSATAHLDHLVQQDKLRKTDGIYEAVSGKA